MKNLLFIATLLISLPLWAQSLVKLDSDLPIEIAADTLEVLQEKRMAIFSGAVEAVQGNITLKAQSMKVYYREAGKQSATANLGAVSRIEVERDVLLTMPEESASAQNGVYNVDKQMVTLVGDVVLARGKNMLRGGRLDYNLKTQKSLLTSGEAAAAKDGGSKPSGGRVKGVFVPGQ
ncbi:MAG: lipopolysaccharide transport periplasmic protein LptA [Rickettsiales bacterium]|nr:lipopolysaccharide transport periplasmic protein LptA [Rickettsiales bacterium]